MPLRRCLDRIQDVSRCFLDQPGLSIRHLSQVPNLLRGCLYGAGYVETSPAGNPGDSSPLPPRKGWSGARENPLRDFFDSRKTGRGVWKWTHYFDIYHRHFQRFVGQEVHVLEVGVFGGGSLEMWKHYFGPRSRIYGVDIREACQAYENEHTRIFIGDQEDRGFWRSLKKQVPHLDVLIDDGGHKTEQQIATLEEMLPHLRPGGVYLCEDVHREHRGFGAYVQGLASNLHAKKRSRNRGEIAPTEFQAWIPSVHLYPYVVVIEKADTPRRELGAPRRGTDWPPALPGGLPE